MAPVTIVTVHLVGVLLMTFAAYLLVAQVLKNRQGLIVLPAGIQLKVPASLLVMFLGAVIFLFPLTPWSA